MPYPVADCRGHVTQPTTSPTVITLTEAVTQQGQDGVAAVFEVVRLSSSGDGDLTDSNGNRITATTDPETTETSYDVSPGAGFTITSGSGTAVAVFTSGTANNFNTTYSAGPGSVDVLTPGVAEVPATLEIHTITPTPVNPTGGTCTIGGNSTAYDATPTVSGWNFDGPLSAGVVTATADSYGPRDDNALAPDGAGLTGFPLPRLSPQCNRVGQDSGHSAQKTTDKRGSYRLGRRGSISMRGPRYGSRNSF